jgi:hypothetical protein
MLLDATPEGSRVFLLRETPVIERSAGTKTPLRQPSTQPDTHAHPSTTVAAGPLCLFTLLEWVSSPTERGELWRNHSHTDLT